MKHSRSSLFLMELIIAILFFSLASAVCIRLFVKSHLVSESTVNQNHAITHAQNMAEVWLSVDGSPVLLSDFFPAASVSHVPRGTHSNSTCDTENACYELLFDADWNPCDTIPSDGDYFSALLCTGCREDGMLLAHVDVCRIARSSVAGSAETSEVIYSLELIHHVPERRSSLHD